MSVRLRRKVTDNDQKFIRVFGTADERNDAMTIVATVDPFKTRFSKILRVESGFRFVESVEGSREPLKPLVSRIS